LERRVGLDLASVEPMPVLTGEQFDTWARKAGFSRTKVRHLAGPTSAVIAYKD